MSRYDGWKVEEYIEDLKAEKEYLRRERARKICSQECIYPLKPRWGNELSNLFPQLYHNMR